MRTVLLATLLSLSSLLLPLRAARAEGLDVEGWLRRPGVKLVVVEFYATWCKPCMKAVPEWKALHDRYRKDGLRLIVVSTRDAGGACASPGWTPDEVVCDDEGFIADRFEANPLPAAYLWGWQGHLLASRTHVEEVEATVERWMAEAPRVDVQADALPESAGIAQEDLRDAVRADLQRSDKLVVVATEEERAALQAIVRRSLELGSDPSMACEVGKAMSANSLVRAAITRGARPRLQLKLLSAERGCLVAAGTTRWNPDKPAVSVSEAVADLLDKLRLPSTQFLWGAGSPAVGPTAQVELSTLRRAPQEDLPAGVTAETSFLFVASEPAGASVFVDGREVGRAPHQDAYPLGEHLVEVRLGELYAPVRQRIRLPEEGLRMNVELPPRFGVLDVRSRPSGAEVFIDGEPTGARTPFVFPKRKQGSYRVELRLDLHKSARAEVRLADGATEVLDLELEPNYGALEVVSEPPGLEVVLDGRATGRRTPARFDRVQVGVHDVEVLGGGRRFGLQRPRIAAGRVAAATVEVEGFESLLRVVATEDGTPVQAEVFLDGDRIGTTPLQKRVDPGQRRVEVRSSSRRRARKVDLPPFETVSVEIDLLEEPERRPDAPRPQKARVAQGTPAGTDRGPRPSRFDSELTFETALLFDGDLGQRGNFLNVGYAFDSGDGLWFFGRLGVEVDNGNDDFGALVGVRLYPLDGRFSLYLGGSAGLLPTGTEALGVGPQLGARLILFDGFFASVQTDLFLLPFAEEDAEFDLLLTGAGQLGFFF